MFWGYLHFHKIRSIGLNVNKATWKIYTLKLLEDSVEIGTAVGNVRFISRKNCTNKPFCSDNDRKFVFQKNKTKRKNVWKKSVWGENILWRFGPQKRCKMNLKLSILDHANVNTYLVLWILCIKLLHGWVNKIRCFQKSPRKYKVMKYCIFLMWLNAREFDRMSVNEVTDLTFLTWWPIKCELIIIRHSRLWATGINDKI